MVSLSVSYESREERIARRELSDSALLARYQAGDKRALEDLLRRHERALYDFLYRLVGSRATAQDLLQEVFLRVLLYAGQYQGRAKVSTWIFAIAKNCAMSQLRRQRSQARRSIEAANDDSEGFSLLDRLAAPTPSPYQKVEAKLMVERLGRALETLCEEQREVFLMREGDEMSHKEIAERIGCPENTVKTRAFRAIGHLRRAMSAELAASL